MTSTLAVISMALFSSSEAQLHEHERGRHGNPTDLDAYIAKMEAPDRDGWQKPTQVIRALKLKPGQVVCDIGSGPGYFSLRIARTLTPQGAVYAVDVEPRILEVLRDRIEDRRVRNVVPVLGLPGDPLIPQRACDLILIVDTFHHFPDPVAYLRRLAKSLRRGGRIANIDFHKREMPVGPPVEHKISREEFLTQATAAGLRVKSEYGFLPYQYFVVLQPK